LWVGRVSQRRCVVDKVRIRLRNDWKASLKVTGGVHRGDAVEGSLPTALILFQFSWCC
jgi:hypothetical protein